MTGPAPEQRETDEFAITGRLASMTRMEAVSRIRERGHLYIEEPTGSTSFLVVGEAGGPLQDDGRPTRKLRATRELQAAGSGIQTIGEIAFLEKLGLESLIGGLERCYTIEQLSRILGVPKPELRRWTRIGLIQPVRVVKRLAWFDFRQVVQARSLHRLTERGVSAHRIAKSIEQIHEWLPDSEGLVSQLEALAKNSVVVHLDEGRYADSHGQLMLPFEQATDPEPEPGPTPIAAPPPVPESRFDAPSFDWFTRGVQAEESGNLDDAVRAYTRALDERGPNPDLYFNLGNVHFGLELIARAAQNYLDAVRLDPEFVEAWNNLGNALSELGEFEEAIVAFERALKIEPAYAEALSNLAEVLMQVGRLDDAGRITICRLTGSGCSGQSELLPAIPLLGGRFGSAVDARSGTLAVASARVVGSDVPTVQIFEMSDLGPYVPVADIALDALADPERLALRLEATRLVVEDRANGRIWVSVETNGQWSDASPFDAEAIGGHPDEVIRSVRHERAFMAIVLARVTTLGAKPSRIVVARFADAGALVPLAIGEIELARQPDIDDLALDLDAPDDVTMPRLIVSEPGADASFIGSGRVRVFDILNDGLTARGEFDRGAPAVRSIDAAFATDVEARAEMVVVRDRTLAEVHAFNGTAWRVVATTPLPNGSRIVEADPLQIYTVSSEEPTTLARFDARLASDCDGNGVSNVDEILAGIVGDCDRDGVPDECDRELFRVLQDGTDPGDGVQVFAFDDLPPFDAGLRVRVRTRGNFAGLDRYLGVRLDGVPITILHRDASIDCRHESDELEIADELAATVIADGRLEVTTVPSGLVEPGVCDDTFLEVRVEYERLVSTVDCDGDGTPDRCALVARALDLDDDGIPDSCEIASGTAFDCDGDGVVDEFADALFGDCDGDGAPDACTLGTFAVDPRPTTAITGSTGDLWLGLRRIRSSTDDPDTFRSLIEGVAIDVDPAFGDGQTVPLTVVVHTAPDDLPSDLVPAVTRDALGLVRDGTMHVRFVAIDLDAIAPDRAVFVGISGSVDALPTRDDGTPVTPLGGYDSADPLSMPSRHLTTSWIAFGDSTAGADLDAPFGTGWCVRTGVSRDRGLSLAIVPVDRFAIDCDGNGRADTCDLTDASRDLDGDGVLDSCERERGDVDLDGFVDGTDLATLLAAWGTDDLTADLTLDGLVDGRDLLVVLSNWSDR